VKCCEPGKATCIASGAQKGTCCPTGKASKALKGGAPTCCKAGLGSLKPCKKNGDCESGEQCDDNGCCQYIIL
jgi:hypothetical protein